MNKPAAKLISIDSAAHGKPRVDNNKRLLDAILGASEERRVLELLEVTESVDNEIVKLARHHPDSRSLGQAQRRSQQLRRSLEAYHAALTIDQLPF